jgi:hypothetical protein
MVVAFFLIQRSLTSGETSLGRGAQSQPWFGECCHRVSRGRVAFVAICFPVQTAR